jgi:lysophospholipase L1-like esterase
MSDPNLHTLASRGLFLGLVLLLTGAIACGPTDETEPVEQITLVETDMADEQDMGGEDPADMPTEEVIARSCEGDIQGSIYLDDDLDARSFYSQGPEDGEDTPLIDHEVSLISGADVRTVLSCDQGNFGFADVEDGTYIIEAKREQDWFVSSSSQGLRFAEAVREGSVKVLVFGDSVPAFGPEPWFPERFKTIVNDLAEVELQNVAVPGSTSVQWLPGANFYRSRLAGNVEDVDLIVFSLGGNDLYEFASTDLNANGDVNELQAKFEVEIEKVKVNILQIITTLREANPDADIVWLLYPNYARSEQWEEIAGDFIDIVETLLRRTLIGIRKDISHHERFLMWDIFAATSEEDLTSMLVDPLHLNDKGHEFYAQELFKLLGGVVVTDGQPSAPAYNIGFATEAQLEQ